MSNEWELVVKGGKHKAKSQLSNKELKKINQNNLNSNKYRLALDEDTDKSLSPEQIKVSTKPKSKKGNSLKGEDDVNQQINKISSESVKNIYSELLERFPNQVHLSLLELTVRLSLMIKATDDVIKTLNFDKTDFPCAFLSNDTLTVLKNIFSGLSNVHINHFLKFAMTQLLDDHDKGIQSIGLRILIQVCVRTKSTVFITNRKNFFDLINYHRDQTTKFKLLTWVLRQACSNYNMACQIWLIYFLPFITQKCHTEFVIGFGEEIKDYPFDTSGNDTSLLVTDFVPIIDLIFTHSPDQQNDRKLNKKKQANFQLTASQIDRLKLIYPKIKDQAFLSKSPGALKDYFASLFLRLSSHSRNGLLNKELLNCLEHCVKMYPEMINQLNHLHLENPLQTKIFLDYLSSENSITVQSIKKSKSFKSLMDKIHSNTLAAPMGSVQDNSRQLTKTCHSTHSFSSCFGTVFRLLPYILLMGFITGSIMYFQYPQQFKKMQKHAAPYTEYVMEKLAPAYKYCELHFLEAYAYAQPLLLVVSEKMKSKSIEFWTYLEPFINELAAKFISASNYLRSKLDEVFPQLIGQIGEMLQSLKDYMTQLSNFFYSEEFQNWMKLAREKSLFVLSQIELGYQYTVNYTLQILGSQ